MSEIEDVMSTNLICVTSETTILEAIELLIKHTITGLPVVDEEMKLCGVVSEKDLLILAYCFKTNFYDSSSFSQTIDNFMTKKPVSFNVNDNIDDVCLCLMNNDFRRVPVLSEGKLVGVISRGDLLQLSIPAINHEV